MEVDSSKRIDREEDLFEGRSSSFRWCDTELTGVDCAGLKEEKYRIRGYFKSQPTRSVTFSVKPVLHEEDDLGHIRKEEQVATLPLKSIPLSCQASK